MGRGVGGGGKPFGASIPSGDNAPSKWDDENFVGAEPAQSALWACVPACTSVSAYLSLPVHTRGVRVYVCAHVRWTPHVCLFEVSALTVPLKTLPGGKINTVKAVQRLVIVQVAEDGGWRGAFPVGMKRSERVRRKLSKSTVS